MARDGQVVERDTCAGPGTGCTCETNTLRGSSHRSYASDTENHLA